jgi:hypothetical protein
VIFSRTIGPMEHRVARRDLTLVAVTVVALSRLLDGPFLWLVAVLVLAALLVGTLQVLAADDPIAQASGVPIESVILPAVAAIACLGAIRLVPPGPILVPALLVAGILVHRCLALEESLLARHDDPTPEQRTAIQVTALIVAFLAFTGVAALVPGGLVDHFGRGPLEESSLALLALADGVVAALLGYRVAALRLTNLRDTLWSAATYALAIAIGAAALRAMEIPRLIGPALLTLAFYLWDAFHGAAPARRRDLRWVWQTLLLVGVGILVILWNLLLRP